MLDMFGITFFSQSGFITIMVRIKKKSFDFSSIYYEAKQAILDDDRKVLLSTFRKCITHSLDTGSKPLQ